MHALKTNEKVFSKQLARLVQTSTPVASLYHKNKLGNIFLTGQISEEIMRLDYFILAIWLVKKLYDLCVKGVDVTERIF